MDKQSYTEIFWIIGAFLISLGIVVALIGNTAFLNTSITIPLYDSYILIEPWIILSSILTVLLLIIYSIKEGINKFDHIVGNIILAMILIGNIIVISYLTNLLSLFQFSNLDWSNFSSLKKLPANRPNEPLILVIRIFLSIQFLFAVGLLILGIKTGTLVKRRVPPTPGWRS